MSTQQRHHEGGSHGPGQNSEQKQQFLPTSDIFKPTPATSASQQRRGTHYQRPKIITQHNYYNQRKELGAGSRRRPAWRLSAGSLTTYRLGLLLQPRFAACLFPAAPSWLFPIKQQCEQSMPFRPLPETKKVKLRRLPRCYGNKESIPETLEVPPRTAPPELQSWHSSGLRVTCTRNRQGPCGRPPAPPADSPAAGPQLLLPTPGGILCKHACWQLQVPSLP